MSIAGKKLCFTGTLMIARALAKKQALAAGATVSATVTGKVGECHLVVV
jgi:NAD-dependent DNA ligase